MRQFQNFTVCLSIMSAKKAKTQQKPLFITSAMILRYFSILPRIMICFLTVETTCSM